jgi:hypothetical protein
VPDAQPLPPSRLRRVARGEKARDAPTPKRKGSRQSAPRAPRLRERAPRAVSAGRVRLFPPSAKRVVRTLRVREEERRLFFFGGVIGDGAPHAPRARRASPRRARRGGCSRGVDGAPRDDSAEPRLERDRFKSRLTCAFTEHVVAPSAKRQLQTIETPLFRRYARAEDGSAPSAPKAERFPNRVARERKRVERDVQKLDRRLIVHGRERSIRAGHLEPPLLVFVVF